MKSGVYGRVPPGLLELEGAAQQFSPLQLGSMALDEVAPGTLDHLVMVAPPGTTERRYGLACGLRALREGGVMVALAPKDKGGARLKAELQAFGCDVGEEARRHHRICHVCAPAQPIGLAAAIAEGALQFLPGLRVWSQPGVFSWDRLDPGSELLIANLPPLVGDGADLGCGIGFLPRKILGSARVASLLCLDIDRRAIQAMQRNIEDSRAILVQGDVRALPAGAPLLDFVVTNPPFHDGGSEDQALGQTFIKAAAMMLRKGGTVWLVANRHLAYESVLRSLFREVKTVVEAKGYKVFEAKK